MSKIYVRAVSKRSLQVYCLGAEPQQMFMAVIKQPLESIKNDNRGETVKSEEISLSERVSHANISCLGGK